MINSALFSSGKDDWETPDELFSELHREFWFDLDVAANAANHKCQVYFTKENSAFNNKWFGTVWCNPPYGKEIGKWVKACHDYDGVSVMLLPARTDTKWFHEYIYKNPKAEIRFLQGRLKFVGANSSASFPSMVVIFNISEENCKMRELMQEKLNEYVFLLKVASVASDSEGILENEIENIDERINALKCLLTDHFDI